MNQSEHLVEEKILQYQAHLDHINKLVERVDREGNLNDAEQLYNALSYIKRERELLLALINKLKHNIHTIYLENTLQKTHPMIVWEAVANKLDGLISPYDHH